MANDDPLSISVVLVDPDDLARAGLRALLDDDPRFTVLRAARTSDEAQIERLRPAIIVRDPATDGELDVRLIAALHDAAPEAYIVVFTTPLERQAVIDATRTGAQMYLLKRLHDTAYILDALAFLARTGMVMVDPAIAARSREAGERVVVQQPSPQAMALTVRELEVLRLYSHDLRVDEIARRLGIDRRTVSSHLANAQHKLGAGTNAELVRLATEQGLLGP